MTAILRAAKACIVVDHSASDTAARATVVLPAATFAEGDGTLVNNEGRAQRFYRIFVPADDTQESWRWLRDLAVAAEVPAGRRMREWNDLDTIIAAMAVELPQLAHVGDAAPRASFRVAGMRIPREPHRYSGRTAMLADRTVHEPKPPLDSDSPLAFSMEGYEGAVPPALVPRYWEPGWNSGQSVSRLAPEREREREQEQEPPTPPTAHVRAAGARLLGHGPESSTPAYFETVPPAFVPRGGEWRVVPLWQVFGSEEQSAASPPIAALAPAAYVALAPEDAQALAASAGELVGVAIDGSTRRLPLRIDPALPRGTAGLPVGLAPLFAPLPEFIKVVRP